MNSKARLASTGVSSELFDLNIPLYPRSLAEQSGTLFFLASTPAGRRLGLLAEAGAAALGRFAGEPVERGGKTLLLCPLTHANAVALRKEFSWLRPTPLGLATSAGCGDRLGLATPGHIRAARAVEPKAANDRGIKMIFCQQSIREMTRTGRSPDDVMDDATWAIFQEGWDAGVGADADHLKTAEDIDRCAAAGYTFFTIDPSAHVDSSADTASPAALAARYEALPWGALETTPGDMRQAYRHRSFDLGERAVSLPEEIVVRAAVKYGGAVAHVGAMHRHLLETKGRDGWELEVSVDETDTPTSQAEHLFVANELLRLGVRWVSLAPRYVGRFEKGVDYLGDVAAFEEDFKGHAMIARAMGPYKLSLHTGSDKFSIYRIASQHTGGLLHLKTAGTSYLEALRATASFDPDLFREILALAIERYEIDRVSYHVSADLAKVPRPEMLSDSELPALLEQFDARQVLHVTFGSVLNSDRGHKSRLMAGLIAHEEIHYGVLERHFIRHLAPMIQ